MAESLEKEIEELRTLFWSERDPEGRVFAPLADAYRRQGDLDQALEVLRDGLDRHSEFAPGLIVAGWVRRDRGELEAAGEAFEAALGVDEENTEALRGVGELATARGDMPAAVEHFQRLVDLEPGDPEIVARLREIERGDGLAAPPTPEVVITPDEASLGTVPDAPEARPSLADTPSAPEGEEEEGPLTRTLADLYARQGLHERAFRVYSRLLERTPEDAGLRERVDAMAALAATTIASGGGAKAVTQSQAETSDGQEGDGGGAGGRATDAEMETLAQDWAEGPQATGELSTPFAWTAQASTPATPDSGRPVREYFRALLDWEPGSPDRAEDRPVVPVASLAPEEVVPVASLAPEATPVVPVESLAPDVVDIGTLAPDLP